MLYSKCTLHTIQVFKPSIITEKCMMGMKSIIRGIRILPIRLRKMAIGNNYSTGDAETNAVANQYNGRSAPHLMIVPTPYALPIIVPIYANERVVKELIKDHYYVLP